MDKGARLAADIGGTFTDVVLETRGRRWSVKAPTTHAAPEDAICEGAAKLCVEAGVPPKRIGSVIHGTTLATNALIERRGAKTALITTKGFRDVIELRTESRFEQYDLDLALPRPLLERQHRYVLDERVDVTGAALRPLDPAAVEALVGELEQKGYESVAVGFLHSYLAPEHERLVREVFAKRAPGVAVSLSSDVSPQMREYERFTTTIANAYVKPAIARYLGRLRQRLASIGITAPARLVHSGGGLMSIESAIELPVRLIESGPAGGAIFAAHVAKAHGIDKALSFDMGGTTAKLCMIRETSPKRARVFEVARSYRFKKGSGMPISIPVIEMVEIGAGGGSIGHVDAMGRIQVGPESAGSEPGPACYGLGGEAPTVTDADLLLGRIDPHDFADGAFVLDKKRAESALETKIGESAKLDAAGAAFAVSEIVDENMANAARAHAVEDGEDPSDFAMIAFGGAAPLHAARLAQKLGLSRILVPPGAGVGSAIGFLRAPFAFEATRSAAARLSSFDPAAGQRLIAELAAEAEAFVEACDPEAEGEVETKLYMRYVGQGWEIPVAIEPALARQPDAEALRARFEEEYAALFGRAVEGLDVEITSWSVHVSTDEPDPPEAEPFWESGQAPTAKRRPLLDPALGEVIDAMVVERADLADGLWVDGPALIVERETTTVAPRGFRARGRSDGCIELIRREGAKREAGR